MTTERFVKAWKESKTMAEVAEKTGYKIRSASTIANNLRSLGHTLDYKYNTEARRELAIKQGLGKNVR